MKQKLQPQGILDFLTPQEFLDGMTRHNDMLLQALGRNARFIKYVEAVQTDAAGNFNIIISPPDGFMWDIRSALVHCTDNTMVAGMYLNQVGYSYVLDSFNMNDTMQAHTYGKSLVLHSSESVVFAPTTAKVGSVSILLFVIEVPNSHEAQLLL